MDVVQQRKAKGFTTTFYVCCTPPKPNNFLFSPPIEGRWIGWYAAAYGYSGFLRWAYDAWPGDPNRDARHGSWPAGDCYMVYPGGNSCIRFEKLREGIVDYVKIRILRGELGASTDKACRELGRKLDAQLARMDVEHGYKTDTLEAQVHGGERLVRELSERLGAGGARKVGGAAHVLAEASGNRGARTGWRDLARTGNMSRLVTAIKPRPFHASFSADHTACPIRRGASAGGGDVRATG